MNETYFVLFIIGLVLVSWILKSTQTEGMETCSRPLRGPKDDKEYPEVYGPSGGRSATGKSREGQTSNGKPVDNSKCSITGQVQKTPGGPIQPGPGLYAAWDDGDVMDSTTMTQNPLYASTFAFQVPSYKMDLSFPAEGPPQPYLTDFSNFHR